MRSNWSPTDRSFFIVRNLTAAVLLTYAWFAASAQVPDRITDEKDIRGAMAEIERSFVSRDERPFDKFYRDDYVSIRSKPVYNGKEQLLAMVRADAKTLREGRPLDYETLAYDAETPRIRFYGNAATVSVMKKHQWRYNDKRCLTRLQSTELWVKGADGWKIAAGHATALQCDPLPWHPPHRAVLAVGSKTKPTTIPDPRAERDILALFDGEMPRESVFVADPVHTGSDGRVTTDAEAIEAATELIRAPFRDNKAVTVFGDGAVYAFRIKQISPTDKSVTILHASIMLARTEEGWRAAATHVSKLD